MSFRFRLTAHAPTPGFFNLAQPSVSFIPVDGLEVRVVPRDSDSLATATQYHFEAGGFPTDNDARESGERLRVVLHVLIAMFGLTLVVPTDDRESGQLSEAARAKARTTGVELLNGRTGLSVLPDDGKHAEFVVAGRGSVVPSSPTYVLDAVKEIWAVDVRLDELTRRALELLVLATGAPSGTSRFLATYLAVESLIPIGKRSPEAVALLRQLEQRVDKSDLPAGDKQSLLGSLRRLHDDSFPSALKAFVATIASPDNVGGVPLDRLARRSIALRNTIAHGGSVDPSEISELAGALRLFALHIIWSRGGLPTVTLNRPPDKVQIDKLEARVL